MSATALLLRKGRERAERRGLLLETLLTDDGYFALATASPVQRAICRVLDGLPLDSLADEPSVQRVFGGRDAVLSLPRVRPKEFLLLAGIRSGKSLIAGACAVRAALTCDVSRLRPGEIPRVPVVSLTMDAANATFAHISGSVQASPILSKLLVGEPRNGSLYLRHPSGRKIEIRVVAGSRAAGSLVSRWLAGVIFDEAPRMVGQDDAVVNLDDARLAVAGRMLPGAQILLIGSPWAPFGPVYELDQEYYAKPSDRIVVVKAPGPDMNPITWTPEACAALQASNPDAYAVDVLVQYLDAVSSLFMIHELQECTRREPLELPYVPGQSYTAAMDPATRGNAWTLVVSTRAPDVDGAQRIQVALAREWIGSASKPLSPRLVLAEIREILATYHLTLAYTDQWSAEAIRDLAHEVGLVLVESSLTMPRKVELYDGLRALVTERRIELPPDAHLQRDLISVRRQVAANSIRIEVPLTADGRHCDYAPSLVLSLAIPFPPPVHVDTPPAMQTEEWYRRQDEEHEERIKREIAQRQKRRR